MVGLRVKPGEGCWPSGFITRSGKLSTGLKPNSRLPWWGCSDHRYMQQYVRSMDMSTSNRHGERITSEFIMYVTYYPTSTTQSSAVSHRHDFQTITVWVYGNDTVRAICLSEPHWSNWLKQNCYKKEEFAKYNWKDTMSAGPGWRPLVARRHIANDFNLGYSLQPVGGTGDDSVPLTWDEQPYLLDLDFPPCLDWDAKGFWVPDAEGYSVYDVVESQPYKKDVGILIPLDDPVFLRIIANVMTEATNLEKMVRKEEP